MTFPLLTIREKTCPRKFHVFTPLPSPMFDLLQSPFFHAFMLAFCFGVLWGFVLHGLLRAPRWLVAMLTTND